MAKLSKEQLQTRNREIQDRFTELNDKAFKENRDFTPEEQREWNQLKREKESNILALQSMATDKELENMRQYEDKNAKLREIIKSAEGNKREITLFTAAPGST